MKLSLVYFERLAKLIQSCG